MNKNARQVNYVVKRDKTRKGYYFVTAGMKNHLIIKKDYGWYAGTCYHQTLRDAIVYVLYGV